MSTKKFKIPWKTWPDFDHKTGESYWITEADFRCPTCKKKIHAFEDSSPDMPGNRYPSNFQDTFELPCGHKITITKSVDTEHHPVIFRYA